MAWCPKCGSEYREGIETCPECGVPLEGTPPAREPERLPLLSEPVLLLTCTNERQLGTARDILEQAGIPCLSRDPGSGEYLRIVFGASMFGTELYVGRSDAARARAALAGLEDEDPPCGENELEEAARASASRPNEDPTEENDSYRALLWLLAAIAAFAALALLARG